MQERMTEDRMAASEGLKEKAVPYHLPLGVMTRTLV